MKKVKTIKINIIFVIIVVFIFLCIIAKLLYIGLRNVKVNDITLSEFASLRDTVKKTTYARRGTIFSSSGEVLAKDVNSYTVIAYLEPSRTKDEAHPYHVIDKELTAEKLSPLINMSKKRILEILNSKIKTCDEIGNCTERVPYQVELGPGGRGITELVKDEIDALDLPGIDFISSTKRYYPNGDFLSYTLGYARRNDEGNYVGEMGIEQYYNDVLTGENGYIEYQSDLQGYQITNTPSVERKSISGNDIYLTIDNNIQMFAEQARETLEKGKPQWVTISVMNAKTGEILAISSSPSFNNNTLEIKSYYDPFVSNTYEPGSTMKIFSFLSAMEAGIYNGKSKYQSGVLKVDDANIRDWNYYGWGKITYDEGLMASSNTAASRLALKLGRAKLTDYYNSLGYGSKTGISLPNESSGIINFKYNTEIASASFGQGITVTAVQMLQAFSALGNKGTIIKPYLVKKIVDQDNNVVFEGKREEVRKVYSENNIDHMIDLMRGVVDGRSKVSTGTGYYVKGYDLVGKTGTAEIATNGKYIYGNYVRSFAGVFPGKDPQVIIYVAVSKIDNQSRIKKAVKNLVRNIGTYLNINSNKNVSETNVYEVKNYINKDVSEVSKEISDNNLNAVVIGDGNKIINQYPTSGTKLNVGNKVFLLTDSKEYKMIDITSFSRNEVEIYSKLINLNTSFEGYGYVKEYSIKKNTVIKNDDVLNIKLEPKYKKE